jgi:hypothetical protein
MMIWEDSEPGLALSGSGMRRRLTEIPPPARLVYRWVLRSRYDAQHRWRIRSPTAQA